MEWRARYWRCATSGVEEARQERDESGERHVPSGGDRLTGRGMRRVLRHVSCVREIYLNAAAQRPGAGGGGGREGARGLR